MAVRQILFWGFAGAVPLDLPLNQWPMIETHDAATGYLPVGALHPINNWAVTQPSDTQTAITTQLNCGARAFDWRPMVASDGTLEMHHGEVTVSHSMTAAVDEMVAWAAAHPNDEDWLLVAVTDCNGDSCDDLVELYFHSVGALTIRDCSKLQGMTLGQALDASKLPGGGHIVAIFDCVDENYDPTVTCSGYSETGSVEQGLQAKVNETGIYTTYTCYLGSSTQDFPVTRMFNYLDGVSQAGPPSTGKAWSMQALWQEDADSVEIGTLWDSDLLLDEQKSHLNSLVTSAVSAGRFPNINLMEVNNVCDGGLDLLTALRATVSEEVVV